MTNGVTFKLEGLEQTVANLTDLPKATGRNVLRRTLTQALEPVAAQAAQSAPHRSGRLAFSIAVSSQLTRRQRRGAKVNEVEMHVGPAGGTGALNYASFAEFGTSDTPVHPFMRPAWDAKKAATLEFIKRRLGEEIERAAARLARKTARFAGG